METTKPPLAHEPTWRAFKDAVWNLLVMRASTRATAADIETAERSLVSALQGVNGEAMAHPFAAHALFDAGVDIGRHVYARRIMDDATAAVANVVASALSESGLGTLEVRDHFHRDVQLGFVPVSPGAHDAAVDAYLGGVLQGVFAEAFNGVVAVETQPGRVFRLRLIKGRDVNQEVGTTV